MPDPRTKGADLTKRVRSQFSQRALKRVCEMHETEFPGAYDMDVTLAPASESKWHAPDYPDFYAFKDNGSNILAVAHLDTVMDHHERGARFVNTEAGPVVFSGALDDRLGAYTILELLPRLGINVDILLTTGEESGNSTAQWFEAPVGKDYLWMIEFDRGGTDVVMYQYEDTECRELVRDSGARVGSGSFSDIAFLDQLEIKGFNWGVGYQDYHGPRSHAFLEDYWRMIGYFLEFHAANEDEYLPHEDRRYGGWGGGGGYRGSLSSIYEDDVHEWHDPEDPDPDCEKCIGSFYDQWETDLAEERKRLGIEDDEPVVDGEVVSEDFETVNNQLLGKQPRAIESKAIEKVSP